MTTHMFFRKLAAALLGGALLVPAFALAQDVGTSAVVNTAAQATTPAGSASVSTSASLTVKEKAAQGKADQEIDRRIQALTDLNTRIQAMQRVTDQFKTALAGNVQTQIAALGQLKAKIDADTDATTLKTDVQSITASYRIFMLVMPQARVAAAADRVMTLVTMMNTLGTKLQTRIAAAQSAGANMSAENAALTDMSAKLQDASAQAQAAVQVTATLQPDNGDKTKMAANTAALKTGRTDIQTAIKDLQAARKDAQTIIQGLAKANTASSTSASASSTTSLGGH